MIFAVARGLVFSGALILIGALIPLRRLIGQLPPGAVRRSWHLMTALTGLFIAGYFGYGVFGKRQEDLSDLIVPAVFFLGACFVWLTALLALQTTLDIMRVRVLERETITDPLTGIFNRRHLDRRLSEEAARAKRYGLPLSLLLIDIDHFKQINDKHGHPAGDQVLVSLGDILAKGLREADIVARYGGEEFVIVAANTALAGAVELAERLRKRIESHRFNLLDEPHGIRAITATVSIGAASFGEPADSAEKLVRAADENLYRAKREGRNRVVHAPANA